jgi:hypothetical protein
MQRLSPFKSILTDHTRLSSIALDVIQPLQVRTASLFNFIQTSIDPIELLRVKVVTRSWGSSVSIASDYGLDDRAIEVRSPVGAGGFSSNLVCPDRL